MSDEQTALDRVLSRVEVTPNGCWEFTGNRQGGGYGAIRVKGKLVYVHRLTYEHMHGTIPTGLQIDHLCRNRACCNPDHLEAVTPGENTRRGNAGQNNARKTHCPQGHPLSGGNLYVRRRGDRCCLTCRREHDRRYRKRIREREAS